MREKSIVIIGAIALIVLFTGKSLIGVYNDIVSMDEDVKAKWANVETQYQRRSDLIPNIVNAVKGFANQEQEVFIGVTKARSKATSVQIDPGKIDATSMQQLMAAQSGLSGALSKLLVSVERYPDLKSDQNFLDLQNQLKTIEDEIVKERQRFNQSVQTYNTKIRRFPNFLIAGFYGFDPKPLFESQSGNDAPTITF